ncbi:hydroxyacylglutathione hydrolase [Corticibacter populi]|uniref:Hydroxyacylglutathione hydrolase n=1 Tax=Corticibacter populi TaxID=1550736 RepID=A0A3M6QLZ7_9BURK|nr:hydroxyacylglutathione hydrolase [Corticibacter populi]RMX04103.1 hydroxyacylglutathione hydrolase [Corticibacter populi]RZS33113.1 hydroxyacylglutathione hydrolase [Corticibacter populi]
MHTALSLQAIPALGDNYIWLLDDGRHAMVVDPGDAAPVLQALHERQLLLQTILITHHHGDHTAGAALLQQSSGAQVFGPAHEVLPVPVTPLQGGDFVQALDQDWQVLDVPGHTAGHIAFFAAHVPLRQGVAPVLFCGDTLFSAGCGRLFEGSAGQMLASLDRLAALPAATLVCSAHEYTLGNLAFAEAVEPDNAALRQAVTRGQRLRERQLPTLPTRMADECAINPFLRIRLPQVRQAIAQHAGGARLQTDADYFAALRNWKNDF